MHMCAALLSVIEGFGAVMSFSLWKGCVTPFFSFSYPSPFFLSTEVGVESTCHVMHMVLK